MTSSEGKVILVGAGPGDPGLITLRGVQCLRRADVVLYDYLVNPQILEHVRPGAELVCLGRHGHERIVPQNEINERLIHDARLGRVVVRLKGGDPTIFARGAEEVLAVVEAGLALEIVPGVTAALAAASYAGIPVTHRDVASCVAFVTGQEWRGKETSRLDFEALARFPGTLVFYMGVTTAPEWSQALIDAGKPPHTPAAVIRRCSWPDQQLLRCQLGQLADVLAPRKMRPPIIVIIGPVVGLSHALNWFETRPLFGQTVLVTRPQDQAQPMRDRLSELGAQTIVQPVIELTEPADWRPVDKAIAALDQYDWLVFSSANGVKHFLDRLAAIGYDARRLGRVKLAAIGPATVDELAHYRLRVDVQPNVYRAEALAQALRAQAQGKRFLLARASRGRELLAQELSAAGAHVDQIVVYQSRDVAQADPEVYTALRAGKIDWTTVTSSAIARSLVRLFGNDLKKTKLVSISPLTTQALKDAGYQPTAKAEVYTADGVMDAILTCVTHPS